MNDPANRRSFLRALSLSPFALTGIGVFNGSARAEAAEAGLIAPNVCLVTPETTAGPFWLDEGPERSSIAEGLPGAPLHLAVQVVTTDCAPVPEARVAIWHCDAAGRYSGYPRQGDTGEDTSGEDFLRGSQKADGQGVARFGTIYPGWYPGRTTHIHARIFLDGSTALTTQVFFPDALSEYLYRYVPPYAERPRDRPVTNRTDRIALAAGEGAFALIRETGAGYEAAMVVGIDA